MLSTPSGFEFVLFKFVEAARDRRLATELQLLGSNCQTLKDPLNNQKLIKSNQISLEPVAEAHLRSRSTQCDRALFLNSTEHLGWLEGLAKRLEPFKKTNFSIDYSPVDFG